MGRGVNGDADKACSCSSRLSHFPEARVVELASPNITSGLQLLHPQTARGGPRALYIGASIPLAVRRCEHTSRLSNHGRWRQERKILSRTPRCSTPPHPNTTAVGSDGVALHGRAVDWRDTQVSRSNWAGSGVEASAVKVARDITGTDGSGAIFAPSSSSSRLTPR